MSSGIARRSVPPAGRSLITAGIPESWDAESVKGCHEEGWHDRCRVNWRPEMRRRFAIVLGLVSLVGSAEVAEAMKSCTSKWAECSIAVWKQVNPQRSWYENAVYKDLQGVCTRFYNACMGDGSWGPYPPGTFKQERETPTTGSSKPRPPQVTTGATFSTPQPSQATTGAAFSNPQPSQATTGAVFSSNPQPLQAVPRTTFGTATFGTMNVGKPR